jgi:hypothetical protein
VGRVFEDEGVQCGDDMNCDKCGKSSDELPWYHVSYNDTRHAFCSRRCLVEFMAPELNKAIAVKQWVPNDEEKRRMSGEEA